jgi:hypothetical protein
LGVGVEELHELSPGWKFRPDGAVFGNYNMGIRAWQFGLLEEQSVVKEELTLLSFREGN